MMEEQFLPPGSFLTVQLVEARNLTARGHGKNAGYSVPYCMISLGGSAPVKSRAHERTVNPVWNQTFDFIPKKLGDYLYIVVKHKTRAIVGLVDDFLGHVSLPMTEFYGKRTVDKWYTLLKNSPKARVSGDIRLKITLGVPGLKYEEEPPALKKQPTSLDMMIDEWVITEHDKISDPGSEVSTPDVPIPEENDKEDDEKGKGKGKGKEKEEDDSDSEIDTDGISSESEDEDDVEMWKQREEEARKKRLEEEEKQRKAEEEQARRRKEEQEEAERRKQEQVQQALQAKRLRKIEKEINDLREIYDVDTSCVRKMEWIESSRKLDVQLGSSDERSVFIIIHLPEDYPEERPVIELEGSFGDYKEGILKAFIDYGNEYAANRHKGLVDILNFFVINYERKFNQGRTLAQSSAGRGMLNMSKALNRSAWFTASLYVPHNEEEEQTADVTPEEETPDGGDYDDWDNEGYFYVRNKNNPLELHAKQVQKIFGAYSIHLLRELNEVVIFLEPSFLQEDMAFALGVLKDRPITVTLTFTEDYLDSSYMPSAKVDQDENPNFRLRGQLMEITYQFLQQYWPLRFDSAAILAGIQDKLQSHESEEEAQNKQNKPTSPVAQKPASPTVVPAALTSPTTVDDALVNNVCTYIVTGRSYYQQGWYFCHTCGLDNNKGCCASCAKVCHAGHNLVYQRVSGFYCDCGDGACATPCQATWKAPQASQLKPSTVADALSQQVCTYTATGTVFASQRWAECLDCGLSEGKGCCMSCVKGHSLRPRDSTLFYCDCGHGGKCKATWVPPPPSPAEEEETKQPEEEKRQPTAEELEAEAKTLQERTVAIKKMLESGYDQLAAIYALEHAHNNVEKAIEILAACGVKFEDIDGEPRRQENDSDDKGKRKADDGEGTIVSAIGNYLRASVFMQKDKGKEKVSKESDDEHIDDEKIKNNNFLAIFMYYMLSRIRNCMNFCIMCDTRLVSSGLKPVVCKEDKCIFRFSELGLGASVFYEMKQDPDYVDLMITMTWAAANSGRRDKILIPFPEEFITDRVLKTKDYEGLKAVLSKMPSVDEMLLAASDERELRKTLEAREPRLYRLLRWILSSNRAHLQKLPADKQVSDMKTPHQYLLLSNSPEKEARFRQYKQQYPAVWAFHGSAIENWHAILRGGLRNLSNTDLMTCGAAYGAGIYLSPHINTSRDYAGTSSVGWPGSRLYNQALQAVAICEIVKDHTLDGQPNPHYVVPNEDLVTTRFFCVFKSNEIPYGLDLTAQLGTWLNQTYPTYGKHHTILS